MTAPAGGGGPGSKSPIKIFANIFISFIGAGVLGLPFAFKEVGFFFLLELDGKASYCSKRSVTLKISTGGFVPLGS